MPELTETWDQSWVTVTHDGYRYKFENLGDDRLRYAQAHVDQRGANTDRTDKIDKEDIPEAVRRSLREAGYELA